jgi:hypothetical protein
MKKGRSAIGLTKEVISVAVLLTFCLLNLQAADQPTPAADQGTKAVSSQSANVSKIPGGKRRAAGPAPNTASDQVAVLKRQLELQQKQMELQQKHMEQLEAALAEQKELLTRTVQAIQGNQASPASGASAPALGQVASLTPVIPSGPPRSGNVDGGSRLAQLSPGPEPVSQANEPSTQSYVEKVDSLSKSVNTTLAYLAGFRFSGDFRLRFDTAPRTGTNHAGQVHNARANYRARFNIDKALNDQLSFHFQVASGTANNPLTYNTDFSGFAARGPIFIGEAWASYHPNSNIDLLGGRLPELFADDSRFLFKEDIRFDGFQENFKVPVGSNPLGITRLELRAGQYILTNPNVPALPSAKACTPAPPPVITSLPATITTPASLPANCAYLSAGYPPGGKVRDADLFHQGFGIFGDLKPGWHHGFIADLQWYRNQNQIALATTAAGAPVVIGTSYGTNAFLPIGGTGTATTTPGGAIFTAPYFQVAHIKYRIGYDSWKVKDHEMPAYIEFHAARNVGAGFLRNAAMGIASIGDTKKAGDVRLLYAFALKEGNSMISEVTDDYLGTLSGVNIRTHEIRFDLGLTRFLAWQNYLYIQNPVSGNDPARNFFVAYPAGAATQYRVQSQVQFKF